MKNKLWLITLVAVIGFSFAMCDIGTAPTITTVTLPNGAIGTAYSQTLAATGDTPITWSIDSGTLPSGLSLTGNVISGTPTTSGTSTFTVKAVNTTGNSTKPLSITIATAGTPDLSGTITISPSTGVIADTELTAIYSGNEMVTYQWNKDGAAINGAASAKFTPTGGGSYTVTVNATGYNSKTSAAITVNAWTAVTDSTFGTDTINLIAYGNGKFVVHVLLSIYYGGGYRNGGKMAYSTDGVTWTDVTDSPFGTDNMSALAYGNNKFVAASGIEMAYSTDGITWTAVTDSTFENPTMITAIAYGNNKFVACALDGKMATSTDGITWTKVTNSPFKTHYTNSPSIVYGNNKFVTGGDGVNIATSTDGTTWKMVSAAVTVLKSPYISTIVYGNNMFLVSGIRGAMAYSSDGETWTAVTDSTFPNNDDGTIKAIAYGNNTFVAGGRGGNIATSTDGMKWTAVTNSTFGTSAIYVIAYGNNMFVAGGSDGKIAYLLDWRRSVSGTEIR